MAEEVIYEQVEQGDPDPLGLRKKAAAKQSGKSDPLGLRKLAMPVEQTAPKSSSQAAATGFTPASNWLDITTKGYQPIMPEAVVDNSHFKNTNEAADRITKELGQIDPHIKNLLYDTKKDLQGRIKSQELAINPTEAQKLNPQAALIESQQREEPKVLPEEIENYKLEMGGNVNMVRNALKRQVQDLSKTDPERANQIKADVYRLDRQENPDKESKIAKNVEKLKEGAFDYDVKKGVLVKPEGFFGSLVTGFKQKNNLFKDYDFYTNTDNEAAIIKELNEKIKQTDLDQAIPVPDGHLGEIGAMIGGQPIKPVVAGIAAGAFTTPVGGAVGGGAVGSHEMYKLGYAAALPQNYAAIKRENPDMPDYEAYTKAKELASDQAMTDAVAGGLMSAVGMRMGLKPTGVSAAFQKSLRSGLGQLAKAGVERGIEGLVGGGVGAAGQRVKNLMAQKAGLPVDLDEGMAEQLAAGVEMTMGMALLMKFPKLLKPSTYNRLTHEIAKMPDDVIAQESQVLQDAGYATPEEVQGVNNAIREQREINNSIRGDVPESDRIRIQEKIKKVNELEKDLETAHKAYHPEIKEEIKKLNDDIVKISKGSERGELQKIVAKSNIEGATAEVLKNASENELNGYFKEIAEQAHDPNSEKLTIETFGEDIVNKAKELYPKKETTVSVTYPKKTGTESTVEGVTVIKPETESKSGVSVIPPGEISRPETITIKLKPDETAVTNEISGNNLQLSNELIGSDVLNADLPDDFVSKSGKGIKVGKQTRYEDVYDAADDMGLISNTTKRLFEFLKGKGIRTTLTNKDGGPVEGMYSPNDSHLRVYKKNANRVTIHEGIHAAINKLGLSKDKEFVNKLRNIGDEVKEKYNANKKEFIDKYGDDFDSTIYQTIRNGNEEELITYFLTNERFRKFANEIGVADKIHNAIPKEIRPQAQPETITIKPKEQQVGVVTGFKTAKGSEYAIEGNSTIRNKAARPEHPGDSGGKEKSLATVYLTPDEAAKADIIYASGVKSRQINRVGDEIHIVDELENGQVKTTKIKFAKDPEVGLQPFEVFGDGGAHLGNKITELIKPKENAIPKRSAETPIVDETPGGGQPVGEGIPESGETSIPQEGQQRPTEEAGTTPGQEGQVSEPEMVGITHAEMDKVSRELGLPEYSKDPETFEGWTREAKDKLAKDADAINKLINKLRNGDDPDPVETQMMKMHFAALKERYNSNPTPELRNELARTKDLYNISGRKLGKQLGARKGLVPQEDSLADFHMRDVEFNRNAPLTDEQVALSTKEYNEIKAAKDAFEAKLKIEQEKNAKLKAEKKLEQEAKAIKRDAKKDYKEERKQILKDISDKWRKSSKGDLGASFVPYAKELAAIAPDIMKLVKNIVGEGITELPKVIKVVHDQIKDIIPNISEKDVHDIIAGEHTKKQSRNQLATTLFDLKKEAQLMNQLDQLLKGEAPVNEKKLRQRNQRIEELRSQIKELKDEMGLNEKSMEEKLEALKGRYKSQIKDIEGKIARGEFGPDENPEPIKLDKEATELKDKLIKLKLDREARLAQQEYGNRTKFQKGKDLAADALDATRTIQTNPDLSFFGRQGIKYLVTHPIQGPKLFWESVKQAFSQARYDRWLDDMHNSPAWELMDKSGLAVLDPHTLHASKREEQWRSQLIHKIPVAGQIAKASERAFTSAANMARADWFMEGVNILQKQGKTFENSPEEYKGWASAVNNMTGRGGLGALEGAVGQLAIPFWSPRLIASNVNLFLNPVYYAKMPKTARLMLVKNMAQYVVSGVAMLGLAKTLGADVEADPRSSDFGKIKVGNTRYDVWGGAAQYIRALTQIFKAQRKSNGGIEKLDAKAQTIVGANLVRSKLSPLIGFGVDVTLGKNIVGEDVELKDAYKLLVPMLYNDIKDAYKDGGADQAAVSGLLSFLGIGAQTYAAKTKTSGSTSGKPSKKGGPTKPSKHSKN